MGADSATRGWAGAHHPALDGIRGAAILVVIAHNGGWVLGESPALAVRVAAALTATGWLGVQLFFVLSGFLITGLLLDAEGTPGALRTFLVRRGLRILPLYYAFLIPILLFGPNLAWSAEWADEVRREQWWYVFYLSNWIQPLGNDIDGLSHLWSLAVEEQFYLVWPLIVLAMTRERLLRLCALTVVATPIIRWALVDAGWPSQAAYQWTVARWDALAMGAALALLARDPAAWTRLRRYLPGAMAFAGILLLSLVLLRRGFQSQDLPVQVLGQTLVVLLSAGLVATGLESPERIGERFARPFLARFLRMIGKYSYAMYIFHLPVHLLLQPYAIQVIHGIESSPRALALVAYLALLAMVSLGLARLSWKFIERPSLAFRDRVAPAPRG